MDALTLTPLLLLLAAVLGLWIHRGVWIAALAAAVGMGYRTGALHDFAALWIALAASFAWLYSEVRSRVRSAAGRLLQAVVGLLFLLIAIALFVPLLPGFTRVQLVPAQVLSPGAAPYGLGVGFPKVVTGILILGLINPVLSRQGLGTALIRALPIWLLTTVMVAAYALAMGYTAFAPKWTTLFLLWAPVNLLFTCLAEEALFRGFVQHELATASKSSPAPLLGLLVAAALFGLAHVAGGATYVVAGLLAGIGYGWAFLRTGRIEASMAVHFGVNASQFLLFAYPRLL